MALQTARLYGISPAILDRAAQLAEIFDKRFRPSSDAVTDFNEVISDDTGVLI